MVKKISEADGKNFFENLSLSACIIIVAVWTLLIYFNSLSGDFVFDDESVVQNNEAIKSLSNIPKFFTADEGFHKVIGKYYRPIVLITYTIDNAIWGMNPLGYHITNLLIHLISCILLLLILSFLFRDYKYSLLFALLATLIFASHAVHTECVAWVSGRTDSLVTLFFFAAFYFYIRYDADRKNLFLYLSLLMYLIGLLSKEMIITMPVIILLYDFIYRKYDRSYIRKNLKAYIWFFGLTIVYLVLRYFLLKNIPDREKYLYFYGFNTVTVIGTMLKTIPVYIKLLFVPLNLLYHYNGVISDASSLLDVQAILSFLLVVLLVVLGIFFYKKDSVISFSIFFFLVSLLPVMNILPTMNLMAERFLYMSSFALSLLFIYICLKYVRAKNLNAFISVGVVIVLLYSFLTFQRNKDWKNNDTLYMSAENIDGTVLLVNSGNYYANRQQFDEAKKRFIRSIEIRDNNVLAHHNLGLVYLLEGNLDSAEIQIRKGMEIDSLAPDGYYQMSRIYQERGDISSAIAELEKLQTIMPDYKGSKDLLEKYKRGEVPQPTIPGGKNSENLKMISALQEKSYKFYQERNFEEAIKTLEELLKVDPYNNSDYFNNMALCYFEIKDYKNALNYFRQSYEADTNNINALSGIADTELRQGNKSKAIDAYRKILAKDNSNSYAKGKLDSLGVK